MKKQILSIVLCLCMICTVFEGTVFAADISEKITSSTVWNDGDVISSNVTISGGSEDAPVVITVNGTVTMSKLVSISDGYVIFTGGGTLLRSEDNNTYSMLRINGGNIVLDNITIDGNNVEFDNDSYTNTNSAVAIRGGTVTLNNGVAIQNSIKRKYINYEGGGAAICAEGKANIVINGGTLQNNISHRRGGAVYLDGGAAMTVNGGIISENKVEPDSDGDSVYGGGGIYVRDATLNITGGTIANNSAPLYRGSGGGIFNSSYGTLNITGGTISGNSAILDGDGIYHSSKEGVNAVFAIGGEANVEDEIYLSSDTTYKYSQIISKLKNNVKFTVAAAMEDRVIAEGDNYTLTYADMAKMNVTNSNRALRLSNNQISLSNTAEEHSVYFAYDANGGSENVPAPEEIKVTVGSTLPVRTVDFSTIPTRDGYVFLGWDTDKNAATPAYTQQSEEQTITIAENTTLYAIWATAPSKTFTITANAETGGTVTGGGTVEEGASVTLTATANDGYIFDGWYDGETKVCDTAEFKVENVTKDKTYTAKFTYNSVISTPESKLFSTKQKDNLLSRAVSSGLLSTIDNIKGVSFVDLSSYDLTDITTADYSADGDGSVKAWFDADTGTLYVGGYGKIIAGESLAYAFDNGHYIDNIVGLDMLNTSAVKNMEFMFYRCGYNSTDFTLDLGDNFDTSNATNMKSMFNGCGYSSSKFALDLGNKFNSCKVTNMSNMFLQCGYKSPDFTLNLGDKFDTSNVTNMSNMFDNCGYSSSIFALDLGDNFNTSKVTSMHSMFSECGYKSPNFTLNLGDKFDTSNVTSMAYMFFCCGHLSKVFTLNLGDKFDTSNVTDMAYMFVNCGCYSPVFTLDLGNKFNTSKVTNMDGLFNDCGKSSTVFTLDLGDSFNTSKVTNMHRLFDGCGKSSTVFTLDLGDNFDTSNVINMSGMFMNCGYSSLDFTLDLGDSFDTSNVTNMAEMFMNCGYSSPDFTLNLGNNFNTSKVTNMAEMFESCGYSSKIFTLDLGNNFDTSNVTDTHSMFWNCGYSSPDFTLNLGNKFNISKATNMYYMFYKCGKSSDKFETLDLSSFTVGSNINLSEFASNIPVTTFIFGDGWANANLSKGMFMSDPELKTILIGATDNLLAYDWAADNRIVDKPVIEYTITANAEVGGTATGGGTVEEGASVTLTATANDGYIFDGWYDGETKVCDTEEFVVENVTADKTYTAKFIEESKPLFDFTNIRAARVNNIVVDHENKTISMNADSNVKYATIYQNQLDIIPNGTIKLADAQGSSIKQNSGSFYIYNNAGIATVLVDISVGDSTDRYSISVSFSEFVADNLRMYQRKIGSTEKDIVYGTDVGYVVGNEIYITPDAGVEYIGLTKYQGKPGNYKGIVTPVESYPTYTTYEESIKSGDYIYVDWQNCIFVRRPQSGDEVRFDVNYEIDGVQSVYTVIVDFSASLDSEINFSSIRTLRGKSIVVDHTNNTITMDSDGKVNNVAIYKYQSDITNGATLTLADAKNSKVTVNPSSFYIADDGTGTASVLVDINYGETTKQYTLNVNFFDGFDFESIRTLRAKNITVDHENKTINMTSDGKVSNVAVYQKQADIIPNGLVKLADANGASVKENAGSFYIENDGNETASVIVDITIGNVTKQYTLNLNFSDGFDFDKIRTLRASDITVDHDAQKIVVTAEQGAKNVAIYMAQTGVINSGKIAMKDEMDSKVQTNAGSYYVIALDDKNVSNIAVDVTIGNKTKTYDVEVCFPV